MEALSSLLSIAVVSFLAAISPGPDFFVVVKNTLSYSRKMGILTALGISLALMIHLTYTMIGIGYIDRVMGCILMLLSLKLLF